MRLGAMDRPRPGKAHTTPTPYLGGVAIALVVAAVSLLLLDDGGMDVALVLACALSVGALGLADDIWDIRPVLRVAGEAVAATTVCLAGVRTELLGGAADVVLTMAWLVLLTNAFNLLDNMDGCAGLVAAVTAAAVAVAAGLQGQIAVGGVAAAVAGSCAAFLLFNWFPARIFMGDAGSLFIGFLVTTTILQLRFPVHMGRLAALVLLAGPALFDTALVVISRLLDGRAVAVGATDHTSHRLRQVGLRVPAVATVIGAATAACATVGVLVGRGVLASGPALATTVVLAGAVLVAFLLTPVHQDKRSADDLGRRPTVGPSL